MTTKIPITVAHGDGIGPEIMAATIDILTASGADLEYETVEIGQAQYLAGHSTGIAPEAWESLRRTKVFLKAPITTPQGGGYKSLNVTVRKTLGLFANIRPCVAYHPFVATKHPGMDVVIVRENEEDLYAGIEHRQTADVAQALKIISRPGSERLIRYGFDYARAAGRKKVTCFTKDNILKITDGLFHKVFDEVAADYPDLENEHWIVDIGAAKLADTPENFDVVVLPNLYGDILSDVAAQIAGSVGLAGSANVGENCAMFEAIHGSAPRRAGQNLANPSGLLLGAVMMLVHVGRIDAAERVHNAWLKTIEDGVHTYDIYDETTSKQKVGTQEFGRAVIERLGQKPETLKAVTYDKNARLEVRPAAAIARPGEVKKLVGVDVFLDWDGGTPDDLAAGVKRQDGDGLALALIANRGMKVWPDGAPETFLSSHWRCRYFAEPAGTDPNLPQIVTLLGRLVAGGFDVIKTENLYEFDGQLGYTVGQGE